MDVRGMDVEFGRTTTAALSLANGDRVHLFAPGDVAPDGNLYELASRRMGS